MLVFLLSSGGSYYFAHVLLFGEFDVDMSFGPIYLNHAYLHLRYLQAFIYPFVNLKGVDTWASWVEATDYGLVPFSHLHLFTVSPL